MYQIVLIDRNGNADAYAAGDPTPGRGANEFADESEACKAIPALGEPENGSRWSVRKRR